MKLHLLLTNDIAKTKPESCKIIFDFGYLQVVFDDDTIREGIHCVVEDSEENIVAWLKQHDYFIKGNGSPVTEQFSTVSVK
jgi:hypothetical protein